MRAARSAAREDGRGEMQQGTGYRAGGDESGGGVHVGGGDVGVWTETAEDATNHRSRAVWCAALLSLLHRPPAASSKGARAWTSTFSEDSSHTEALLSTALQLSASSTAAAPSCLLSVEVGLTSLPARLAADSAAELCTAHGLLECITRALGPIADGRTEPPTRPTVPIGTSNAVAVGAPATSGATAGSEDGSVDDRPLGTSPRALATSLRVLATLVTLGGDGRRLAGELPLLNRPSLLPALLEHNELRRSAPVQAAGCALIRTVLTAGGGGKSSGAKSSQGLSSSPATSAGGLDAVVTALAAHGSQRSSHHHHRIAVDACEILGVIGASHALSPLLEGRASLLPPIVHALSMHGKHRQVSQPVSQSAGEAAA